ncbi:MAG: DUF1570 domain-containing protein [Planctomycetes bacterium]|nr:DUF1570 domain-containing protein [Planctomycetota bacterium]
MPRYGIAAVLICFAGSLVECARADYIVYDLGNLGSAISGVAQGGRALDRKDDDTRITLPGTVVVQPGRIVSYTHPNGSKVNFALDEVKIIKARTAREEFNRRLSQAGKDPDKIMQAAVWGLKKALLPEFYRAVDKVLEIDPSHQGAQLVEQVKKKIKEPLPDDPDAEKTFKSLVKQGTGMRVEKSKHFMLLTDTPLKPEKAAKGEKQKTKNRAAERLDLLEQVYESFVLLFHAQDISLDIPSERMMVVLFEKYEDFRDCAKSLSPALASASGFWDPITNISYFFDYGSSARFEMLKPIMTEMKKIEADAQKARDPEMIRFNKVLRLLVEVEKQNSDITVVSHECCHQMAGNTGLLPRHVDIPKWVHEGLATYFEAPASGGWAGIGAVSTERLVFYRILAERDEQHSNLDFVASDQIFDKAISKSGILFGYAHAWGLTHFLFEKHLKELVTIYRVIGQMPPDVQLNPDILMKIFHRAFGTTDTKALNEEWRSYMRTIKTDLELLGEASK